MTYTKEEQDKIDTIKDLMRGGPRQRLKDFAHSIHVSYDELMAHADEFVRSDGNSSWNEGDRFEGVGLYDGFWGDYELVTGVVTPPDIKQGGWGFFSCAC